MRDRWGGSVTISEARGQLQQQQPPPQPPSVSVPAYLPTSGWSGGPSPFGRSEQQAPLSFGALGHQHQQPVVQSQAPAQEQSYVTAQLQQQLAVMWQQLQQLQHEQAQFRGHLHQVQEHLAVSQQQVAEQQQLLSQLQQDLQRAQQQLHLANSSQEQLAAEVQYWHREASSRQVQLQQLQQRHDSNAAELELWHQWGAQQQAESEDAAAAAPAQSFPVSELVAHAYEAGHSPSAAHSHCSSHSVSSIAPSSSYCAPPSPSTAASDSSISGSSAFVAAPVSVGSLSGVSRLGDGVDTAATCSHSSGGSSPLPVPLCGGSTGPFSGGSPVAAHPHSLLSSVGPGLLSSSSIMSSSSSVNHSSNQVSSVGDPRLGFGGLGVFRLLGSGLAAASFGFGGSYAPAAPQVRSMVGFSSVAAAAAQPVQFPERTAGGLDQMPWSRSVGGPGPPCFPAH